MYHVFKRGQGIMGHHGNGDKSRTKLGNGCSCVFDVLEKLRIEYFLRVQS